MDKDFFHFQQFSIKNSQSAFKINTDGVLLAAWVDVSNDNSILDIGTGTSVISHICHQRNPDALITGIDIDKVSCEEAVFSVNHNRFSKHISIVNEDVRDWKSGISFDHIITNPPYFDNGTKPSNIRLTSAKHSVSLSSESLWKSNDRLSHAHSKVSLILPFADMESCIVIACTHGFFPHRVLNIKNRSKGKYIRAAIEFSRLKSQIDSKELIIHSDGDNYYSDAFIDLHKDLNMIFKDL